MWRHQNCGLVIIICLKIIFFPLRLLATFIPRVYNCSHVVIGAAASKLSEDTVIRLRPISRRFVLSLWVAGLWLGLSNSDQSLGFRCLSSHTVPTQNLKPAVKFEFTGSNRPGVEFTGSNRPGVVPRLSGQARGLHICNLRYHDLHNDIMPFTYDIIVHYYSSIKNYDIIVHHYFKNYDITVQIMIQYV